MIRKTLVIAAALAATSASTASTAMPAFTAKCGDNLNVDTNPRGQVSMNGKLAKTINHPDSRITAKADGDMTVQASKHGDVFKIRAGHERYEIIEAVVFGG